MSAVMSEPATKPTRSESASHVGVESRLKIERAERTHRNSTPESRFEKQEVSPRFVRDGSQ